MVNSAASIMKKCCIKGCLNSASRTPEARFFVIPKGKRFPDIRQKWIEFTENPALLCNTNHRSAYVCHAHFKDDDFGNTSKTRLKFGVCPSLLPPLAHAKVEMPSIDEESIQYKQELDDFTFVGVKCEQLEEEDIIVKEETNPLSDVEVEDNKPTELVDKHNSPIERVEDSVCTSFNLNNSDPVKHFQEYGHTKLSQIATLDFQHTFFESGDDQVMYTEQSDAFRAKNDFDTSVTFDHTYNKTIPQLEYFCRICGSETNPNFAVSIFSTRGERLGILGKITQHLKIEVAEKDGLPHQVCSTCVCHLNICHKLYEISQKTQAKLATIFQNNEMQENFSLPVDQEKAFELDYINVQENQQVVEFREGNPFEKTVDEDVEVNERLFNRIQLVDDTMKTSLGGDWAKFNKVQTLCELCGKSFSTRSSFARHIHQSHSAFKKHSCTECPKSFTTANALSEHMNIHNDYRPYSCPFCEKKFYKQLQLSQHRQVHMPDFKGEVCKICGKMINHPKHFRAHIRSHFREFKGTYRCWYCKDNFVSRKLLLAHREIHIKERRRIRKERENSKKRQAIFCDLCGRNFNSIVRFQKHKRLHLDQNKFYCTLCTKSYSQRRLLVEHVNVHKGIRPFKCSHCEKRFYKRPHLHAHLKSHTFSNSERVMCEICGTKCKTRGSLSKHIKIHNNTHIYSCKVCNEEFRTMKLFLEHKKVHMQKEIRIQMENKQMFT